MPANTPAKPLGKTPAKAPAPELRPWRAPRVLTAAGPLAALSADDLAGYGVLAVPVAPGGTPDEAPGGGSAGPDAPPAVLPRPGAADAAVRYDLDLAAECAAERVSGRAGTAVRLPVRAPAGWPRVLHVVGAGTSSPADLRRAAAALARAAGPREDVVTTLADGTGPAGVRAVVEGFLLASWTPPAAGHRARGDEPADQPAGGDGARRLLLVGDVAAADVEAGLAAAAATVLARDLAATPSNLKDPAWTAARAREVAAAGRLRVDVRDAARLEREGFGGLVAVGGASASPPALVEVAHVPRGRGARSAPHVVLVGKGITFDTGGLSLKPRESMVSMKTDMSGAAAVLAAVAGAARRELPLRVTGLLPLAENALGASSYRPGDVVTHYGGRTTEVANTDAEGRLVLADALAYADARLEPDLVVDVATLTGAATQGLGKRHGALFTGDEELAAALLAAGEASGERLWRMPMVEEYAELVESHVADARQVAGVPGAGAGAIVAALFLRPFAGGRRWAHLDIAGPARADAPEHEVPRGATGFGARLLLTWLEQLAGPALER
ncbi:leucyl aminopeptidase family protein [Kineococcus sp. SYSU DK004]|uniref:leucyl aminopeptidase family protein n=1 Tax=Kineococcus sp. SYSU DK004 TaxID=3383125 RepID=UPI003D7E1F39